MSDGGTEPQEPAPADDGGAAFTLPDGFPEALLADEKPDFGKIMDLHGQAEKLSEAAAKAREGVPDTAAAYEAAFSEDLKIGDEAFTIADNDLLGEVRAFAHELGLPQEKFSQALTLMGKASIGLLEQMSAEVAAADRKEIAALAPKGTPEADQVKAGEAVAKSAEEFLAARFGDEGKALASQIGSAAAYHGLAKIIAELNGPDILRAAVPASGGKGDLPRWAQNYPDDVPANMRTR